MKDPVKSFKTSVFRPNLYYEVIFKDYLSDEPFENLKGFIEKSLEPISKSKDDGCGIIYCKFFFIIKSKIK